ncbi:MAG: hypothetical protein ABI743_08005, partial [bacterium]
MVVSDQHRHALAEGLSRFAAMVPPDLDSHTDRYFLHARAILGAEHCAPRVTMQVFAKQAGIVAGLYEAINIVQQAFADSPHRSELRIETLLDGDTIAPREPVLKIHGDYITLAACETTLLGVLARR